MPGAVPSRRLPEPPPQPPRKQSTARILWLVYAVLLLAMVGRWWAYSVIRARAERASAERAAIENQARLDVENKKVLAEAQALQAAIDDAKATLSREEIVDDPAGKLLWASPTTGAPISLAYVPDGTQCLVYLRPAMIAAHAEGEKVLAALGPWGKDAAAKLEALAGAPMSEIDSALIAVIVLPNGKLDARVRSVLRKTPTESTSAAGVSRVWKPIAKAGDDVLGVLIVGPLEPGDDLTAAAQSVPILARDMEALVAQSDADRMATIILEPKFLQAGGNHLVEGEAAPLRDALAVMLKRDATAVSISANLSDSFFVEVRATPALNVSPRYLATMLATRLASAAETIKGDIEAHEWPEYGRAVLAKFPEMMVRLAAATRGAESDKQAVVRAYLPAVAGHNLLMGAELLLTQAGSATGPATAPEKGKTVAERLATVTTLTFPKESLQKALELLSADIGVPISIDGKAFQAAGVTQNQTLSLELREKPAAEILVEILRRTNPDRTATGPADSRQTLVYLVEGEAAAGGGATGGGRIIVTTRAAAKASGAALPAVFVAPQG